MKLHRILCVIAILSMVLVPLSNQSMVFAPSMITLSVESADMAGNTFPGQWVELWRDGVIIQEGFTPFSASVETGVEHAVSIDDDPAENKFFNNWENGSTNPTRTITLTQNTFLTAFFQTDSTTVNLSVESADMAGNTFPGQWVELWKGAPWNGGVIIQEGFTPFSATVESGVEHAVFIYNDPAESKFFVRWENGSTNPTRVITLTQSATLIAFFETGAEPSPEPGPIAGTITRVSSGLVASDPLTQPKTNVQMRSDPFWTTGGSAEVQGAPFDIFQDSTGLNIATQALSSGTFAGFFAVTPPEIDAMLHHAVITTPFRTVSSDFFQQGLFVQTSTPSEINFVVCMPITSTAGTTWHLIHSMSSGTLEEDTVFEVLWSDPAPAADQPLSRDCTIVTNGSNFLRLYMDNQLVFDSDTLNLQMDPPFRAFLEVQNSSPTWLFGIYRDFYATLDENIRIINVPSNAVSVIIVDTADDVLASAPVVNGEAVITIGQFNFPLAANIRVLDSNNAEIASTSAPADIFGGDIYSVQ